MRIFFAHRARQPPDRPPPPGRRLALKSIRGSHHKFVQDGRPPLIVPHPKKALPLGTARAIARAAGWLESKQ